MEENVSTRVDTLFRIRSEGSRTLMELGFLAYMRVLCH